MKSIHTSCKYQTYQENRALAENLECIFIEKLSSVDPDEANKHHLKIDYAKEVAT